MIYMENKRHNDFADCIYCFPLIVFESLESWWWWWWWWWCVCVCVFVFVCVCVLTISNKPVLRMCIALQAIWQAQMTSEAFIGWNRINRPWWRHKMETFSVLLVLCEGNPSVTGGFPLQRPVTRSFDVFFDLHQAKCWGNNRDTDNLERHRAHYVVTVMRGRHGVVAISIIF